jgi:hypothetical protein
MHTRLLFSSLHNVGPFFKSELFQLFDRIDAEHAPHSCQPAPNHAELNANDQK